MYGMVEQPEHKSETGNLHLPGTPEEKHRAPFGKMDIQLLIINPLNSEQAGRHTRVFFFKNWVEQVCRYAEQKIRNSQFQESKLMRTASVLHSIVEKWQSLPAAVSAIDHTVESRSSLSSEQEQGLPVLKWSYRQNCGGGPTGHRIRRKM